MNRTQPTNNGIRKRIAVYVSALFVCGCAYGVEPQSSTSGSNVSDAALPQSFDALSRVRTADTSMVTHPIVRVDAGPEAVDLGLSEDLDANLMITADAAQEPADAAQEPADAAHDLGLENPGEADSALGDAMTTDTGSEEIDMEVDQMVPRECQDGAARECGSNVGACEDGVQSCVGGFWSDCIGAEVPSEEVCNLLDDDCDGQVDEGAVCPCATYYSDDHVYLACGGENDRATDDFVRAQTWHDASLKCASVGFYLATITSEEENENFFRMLQRERLDDTWIGLNDQEREDQWVWSNGEQSNYRNWDRDEPNDGSRNGEDCGIMLMSDGRASRWDDRPCERTYSYVCKWDR